MRENYLLNKLTEVKLLIVNKSYHANFNNLTQEELEGLCTHDTLLERVHAELKSDVAQVDIDVFRRNLQVFRDNGEYFNTLYTSIMNERRFTNYNFIDTVFLTKPTGKDFNPVYQKLADKTPDPWPVINNCLYEGENTDVLRLSAVESLAKGFSLTKLSLYPRLADALQSFANYVGTIWNSFDFSLIYSLCKVNEKFVFVLLYPFFFRPLGEIIWPTLLPHFHFVYGSFTKFMQKVCVTLNQGNVLTHTFNTLSKKKATFVGISSFGLMALFSNFFTVKANQGIVANAKLYQGLSGSIGGYFKIFRVEGSKLIYETFKTASTFTNAAIAGAMEPKQEAFSSFLKLVNKKI